MTDHSAFDGTDIDSSKIGEIVEGVIRRREAGERVEDQEVIDAHIELMPELEKRLAAVRMVQQAREEAVTDVLTGGGHRSPRSGKTPDALGPYKILEQLGAGGMGVVYLAEQLKPIRRRVALKVIKLGMDTKQVIARFESERQALALMSHPNVAKVLDAGTSDEGRPYFVMDYVRGVSIVDYCDRHRLPSAERLRLFLHVCHAVQHAHQKGIIHRDIKPSNVLVAFEDGQPVPRIIDFGIARAIEQKLTEQTLFTEQGQLVGTPEYMSPEQAEMTALDVDTRTDIYSLGVLLYELLVGALPFDPTSLRKAAFGEIQRIIREQEPPKPSTRLTSLGATLDTVVAQRRTDPKSLARELRGDLDWIVMKAMDKDRTRRYSSASEFADDISRHLHHEPTIAGAPSAVYRLKKFVRRNRGPVAAGLGAFLLIMAGSVTATVLYLRAETERQRAVSAEVLTARSLAQKERAYAAIDSMNNYALALRDKRNFAAASEILQLMFQIQRELLGVENVSTINAMGNLALVLWDQQKFGEAEALYRTTLEVGRRVLGREDPKCLAWMSNLSSLLQLQGHYADAETIDREVVKKSRKVFGNEHIRTLGAMRHLGRLLIDRHQYEEAEIVFRQTVETSRQTFGERHLQTASSMGFLGDSLGRQGKYDEAETILRGALQILRTDRDAEEKNIALNLGRLGSMLRKKGDYDASERLYHEQLGLRRKIFGDDHPYVAQSTRDLGLLLRDQGRHEEACTLLRESLEKFSDSIGDEFWHTARARCDYGDCLRKLQRFEEAERELQEAYKVLDSTFGAESEHTRKAIGGLKVLYESWGKPERATKYRDQLNTLKNSATSDR